MNYRVLRINSQMDFTIGVLFVIDKTYVRKLCYTLEDEFREVKVDKETRIPAGIYELKLRENSPLSNRYRTRYPDIHQGMIWLQAVPGFKYIYIHAGNDDDDTDGCMLVGSYQRLDKVLNSRSTYSRIYPGIVKSIKAGPTYLEIIDYDTPPKVIT